MTPTYLMAQDYLNTANNLYSNKEYKAAIEKYKLHLSQFPTDSASHYKIGNSYQITNEYNLAIKHLFLAAKNGFYPGFTYSQIGRNYAYINDRNGFIQMLDSLVKYNPGAFRSIEQDTLFSIFLTDNVVVEKLNKMKTNAYPCLKNDKSRLFDFWIGEWDVFANGRKVGKNVITKANGGCAIHESYVTPGAYTGQSINFVDTDDNLWKQYWVGSSGDVGNYKEVSAQSGKLVFLAKVKNKQQKELWTRMTFTYDQDKDQVKQYIESSNDKGDNWTVVFDGLYKKKQSN